MNCRSHCGACCIAPSIVEPFYKMPMGKPAGHVCIHLNKKTMACAIWQTEHYPETCKNFQPHPHYCGTSQEEAITILSDLEESTRPQG